jgi:hypothetical protein
MSPEIERLLGGYATRTLNEDERKLLYQAALEDQDLFNALEDEQALRDLLADDISRREVGQALRPVAAKPRRWWLWGAAAATATAALVLVLVLYRPQPSSPPPQQTPVEFRAMTTSAVRQAIPKVPLLILRNGSELKQSESVQAGDSIQLKVRPPLPGTLTVSELVRNRAPKTLPADVPIKVEGPRIIRVQWRSSSMAAPRVTFLELQPGKPVQQH